MESIPEAIPSPVEPQTGVASSDEPAPVEPALAAEMPFALEPESLVTGEITPALPESEVAIAESSTVPGLFDVVAPAPLIANPAEAAANAVARSSDDAAEHGESESERA